MKAQIKKETDTGFGVLVTDNNLIEHKIGVQFDGHVDGHLSDDYPDKPDERTKAGNEHVNQARRFAKYWVYRKRGYDTLDGWRNPDRIALAATALMAVDTPAVDQYLGDLDQQLQSLYSDVEPAVDVAEGVDPTSAIYKQDLYLGLDDRDAAAYADILAKVDVDHRGELSEGDFDGLPGHDDGLFIESAAGPHITWDATGDGQYRTQWADQPVDRDPDARIELLAFKPESIVDLKRQAVRNLLCQVRDCYLTMGITPPEQFRLLGHGQHDASTWYVHNDLYEAYYDPDAEVDTWFEAHSPENAYEHTVETQAIDPA